MKYTVIELFAGVGGFRLGLERAGWKTIWANQWEPATKSQPAADCYLSHFPDQKQNPNFNIDIAKVTEALNINHEIIPDHKLLVGGFPCQDYSVAATQAKGILGKKGVLWWEIEKIIAIKSPEFVLLENVDRLLVSPSKQRGRDMGIVLASFRDLGYSVEWRVVNAADYGFPQKRRRVFIFASRIKHQLNKESFISDNSFFSDIFPIETDSQKKFIVYDFKSNLQEISDNLSFTFFNSGLMLNDKIYTCKVKPKIVTPTPLASVLQDSVNEKYFINDNDIEKVKGWKYVKGAKKEFRTAKNGHQYYYTEGAIPFPDNLNSPSRTILTGEGNQNPNRSTHLILDPIKKAYRTLTPIEVERLNGFDDDWTNTGMSESKRYFCMGNALVVGIIEVIGKKIKTML